MEIDPHVHAEAVAGNEKWSREAQIMRRERDAALAAAARWRELAKKLRPFSAHGGGCANVVYLRDDGKERCSCGFSIIDIDAAFEAAEREEQQQEGSRER